MIVLSLRTFATNWEFFGSMCFAHSDVPLLFSTLITLIPPPFVPPVSMFIIHFRSGALLYILLISNFINFSVFTYYFAWYLCLLIVLLLLSGYWTPCQVIVVGPFLSQLIRQSLCRIKHFFFSPRSLSPAHAFTRARLRVPTPFDTNRLFLYLNSCQLDLPLALWTQVLHHSLWTLYRLLAWTILAQWTRVRHHSLWNIYVLCYALSYSFCWICALVLSRLHSYSKCLSVYLQMAYL